MLHLFVLLKQINKNALQQGLGGSDLRSWTVVSKVENPGNVVGTIWAALFST